MQARADNFLKKGGGGSIQSAWISVPQKSGFPPPPNEIGEKYVTCIIWKNSKKYMLRVEVMPPPLNTSLSNVYQGELYQMLLPV